MTSPLSALRSPLSALRSSLSALRSPQLVFATCLCLWMMSAEARAQACGTWNPSFSGSPKSGHESRTMAMSWTANAPAACTGWGGTHHLQIHRADGTSTPPSAPTSGTFVATRSNSQTSWDDILHRSNKTFAYAIFACEDAGCSSWYGQDGAESLGEVTFSDSTEPEKWELVGISGSSVLDVNAVNDHDANAPHAFFYPSSWPDSALSNKLVLLWSTSGNSSTSSEVFYQLYDATGWPSGGFNTSWSSSNNWATAELVAEGSTTVGDEDFAADHPWVMLTMNSSSYRAVMMAQSQHTANGHTSYNDKIVQVQSAGASAADFGMSCSTSGGTCTDTFADVGSLAVDADGTSGTDYVAAAGHGRILWDYISNPVVNTSGGAPFLLFQYGYPLSGTCSQSSGSPDDIVKADGSWNGSKWVWSVDLDAGGCPDLHIQNGHDNTYIPLPDGEFKVYYKDHNSPYEWHEVYWDGGSFVDDTTVEFYWDGSTSSGPSPVCIENASALVYVGSGGPAAGMFFKLLDSDESNFCSPNSGDGLDDDGGLNDDDSRIVFAQLSN